MLNLRSQRTLQILATQKINFGQNQQEHYAIVTEKIDGSLLKFLKQKRKLTEAQTIEWARKIIECYKYLYKARVMHRDLKPDNVLYRKFGDQYIFKIRDFGLSRNSNTSKLSKGGKIFSIIKYFIKKFERNQEQKRQLICITSRSISQESLYIRLENVCIYQSPNGRPSEWLCSSELCDGAYVFTIKVHKLYTYYHGTCSIQIGVMQTQKKGEKREYTWSNCVSLYTAFQNRCELLVS